jgi:A/G-specific adenine glycosylase
MERCGARLEGREAELPLKTKAKPPRPEARAVALVEGSGPHAGKLLVRQRPTDGLLARMWELPHVALAPAPGAGTAAKSRAAGGENAGSPVAAQPAGGAAAGEAAAAGAHAARMAALRAELAASDGVDVVPAEWLRDAEHTFSHIRWDMDVYRCRLNGPSDGSAALPPNYRWLHPDEMEQYAFPNVFLRILADWWEL